MDEAVVRQAGGEVDVDHDIGGFDVAMHVHLHVFVGFMGDGRRLGMDESNGSGDVEDYLEALVPIQGGVAEGSSTLADSKETRLRGFPCFSHEYKNKLDAWRVGLIIRDLICVKIWFNYFCMQL